MATSERQKLLESGEARGILRPEHKAELAKLRAASGGGSGGYVKPTAKDIESVQKANEGWDAAVDAIRTYDHIQPVLDRFNTGPGKGMVFSGVMPDGGGLMDTIGATAGSLVRPLLKNQDEDDYQVIGAAVNRNVKNWHKIEKGVQTAQDDVIAARTDFMPTNSPQANRRVIAKNRHDAEMALVRTATHNKWVAKYGSISRAAPTGKTFADAVAYAQRDYMASKARRQAPPSTRRKANSGWSVVEE